MLYKRARDRVVSRSVGKSDLCQFPTRLPTGWEAHSTPPDSATGPPGNWSRSTAFVLSGVH